MNLHDYSHVLINSSGGKDSQTALRVVVKMADEQKYPRDQLTVFHADLERMEWKGVRALAQEQAEHYGLKFVVSKYRDKNRVEKTLLDYVRERGKWPSATQRFCTSEFKRSPGQRTVTAIHRAIGGDTKILQVFGFRAEESPARAKHPVLAVDSRCSTKERDDGGRARTVWRWLPIHEWTEEQVWADIKESGVRHHEAYDAGMPRLSCCFCIFAPKAALMIAGKLNPELLDEYVQLEAEIGHDFKHKQPIREIKEALDRGEKPDNESLHGAWNM